MSQTIGSDRELINAQTIFLSNNISKETFTTAADTYIQAVRAHKINGGFKGLPIRLNAMTRALGYKVLNGTPEIAKVAARAYAIAADEQFYDIPTAALPTDRDAVIAATLAYLFYKAGGRFLTEFAIDANERSDDKYDVQCNVLFTRRFPVSLSGSTPVFPKRMGENDFNSDHFYGYCTSDCGDVALPVEVSSNRGCPEDFLSVNFKFKLATKFIDNSQEIVLSGPALRSTIRHWFTPKEHLRISS